MRQRKQRSDFSQIGHDTEYLSREFGAESTRGSFRACAPSVLLVERVDIISYIFTNLLIEIRVFLQTLTDSDTFITSRLYAHQLGPCDADAFLLIKMYRYRKQLCSHVAAYIVASIGAPHAILKIYRVYPYTIY